MFKTFPAPSLSKVASFTARTSAAVLLALSFHAGGVRAQPSGPNLGQGKGAGPRTGLIDRIEIVVTNRSEIDRLVQSGYDVDAVRSNHVVIYADPDEAQELRKHGLKWLTPVPPVAASNTFLPQIVASYHDYASLSAVLAADASNYPAICRLESVGKSVQGRNLWALKITTCPDYSADKPKFKYIGTMHANEPLGTEMCLGLIDRLLTGYTTNDSRIVRLLNQVEIWILPLMNPDGREANPPQRYNANGYDLNRSFPEGSDTDLGNQLYGPPLATNGLQPEVAEVMAWTVAHHFTLGANFHTGDVVVNYPYDNDNMGSVFSPSPDEALLQAISRAYSSNNPPMWNSSDFPDGIVNGAAWYAISGGMQDWNYRYAGCFDTTIEISYGQWPEPTPDQIPICWGQNQESMLAYLEWVLKGVRGVVRDAKTGHPVAASVRVEGYPHRIFSDPAVGDYHRILLPGQYTLWFEAPGYLTRRVSNVNVTGGQATRLDVLLQPDSPRFAVKINFQPAQSTVPAGYLADSGAAFGDRGNGFQYGWTTNLPDADVVAREAGRSQDLRYDSFCRMPTGVPRAWHISVPNGFYWIHLAAGDPSSTNGVDNIAVGVFPILNGAPTSTNRWIESIGAVRVRDRTITLSSSREATNVPLDFVEISALDPVCLGKAFHNFPWVDDFRFDKDRRVKSGEGWPNLPLAMSWPGGSGLGAGRYLTPRIMQANNADYLGCFFWRDPTVTNLELRVQTSVGSPAGPWTDLVCCTNGCTWTGPGLVREWMFTPDCVAVEVFDSHPVGPTMNRFLRLQVVQP